VVAHLLLLAAGCLQHPTDSAAGNETDSHSDDIEQDTHSDETSSPTDTGDGSCAAVTKRVTIGYLTPYFQTFEIATSPWLPISAGHPPNLEQSNGPWGDGIFSWSFFPRIHAFEGDSARFEARIVDVATGAQVWTKKGTLTINEDNKPCSGRTDTGPWRVMLGELGGSQALGDHPFDFLNGNELFITIDVEGIDPADAGTYHADAPATAIFPPP
jgi:hypothetical protein